MGGYIIFAILWSCSMMCFKHCKVMRHTNLMNKDFIHEIECFILQKVYINFITGYNDV